MHRVGVGAMDCFSLAASLGGVVKRLSRWLSLTVAVICALAGFGPNSLFTQEPEKPSAEKKAASADEELAGIIQSIRELKRNNFAQNAADLAKFGVKARDECIHASKGATVQQRVFFLLTLRELYRPGDKVSEGYFYDLLKDPSEHIRASAAGVVGEAKISRAIPLLIEMLEDQKHDHARHAAASALGQFGADAALAISPLKKIAHNRKNASSLRCRAASVMGQIDPESRDIAVYLKELFADESESHAVRSGALIGLFHSNHSKIAMPTLLKAMSKAVEANEEDDTDLRDFRIHMGAAIGSLTPTTDQIAIITQLFANQFGKDKLHDIGVRSGLLVALGNAGHESKAAIPVLLKALSDENLSDATVEVYAFVLVKILPPAEVVRQLAEYSHSSNDTITMQRIEQITQAVRSKKN